MKTIEQKYQIKAYSSAVFEALTDSKIIEEWSGAKAVMNAKVGTKFSLWEGDMFGVNLEIVKNKKIVQEWCTNSFKSKVTFLIIEHDDKTTLELMHENVPNELAKDYSDGWKQYYLGAIKEFLEKQSIC